MTTKHPPGTLRGTLDEIKDGTFLANARRRSSRRKSAWNLLLPLFVAPLWIVLWWMGVEFAWLAHIVLFRRHTALVTEIWTKDIGPHSGAAWLVVVLPLLLPAMVAAMVLANFLVYQIPAARRAMNAEDRPFPGTDYATAQKSLARLTGILLPIALVLTLLGVGLLEK